MSTQFSYTVKGQGHFPIDMLRYDACRPATEEDSLKIFRSIAMSEDGGKSFKLWEIAVIGNQQPTSGRWKSFLCEVGPVTVEQLGPDVPSSV